MVVCVIILLLLTAGFPEYDAVYIYYPEPNAEFTVPENSPSYDVATVDLVGTTPSVTIKEQEPTQPPFELVKDELVEFPLFFYILSAPALDFEANHTYTVTLEAFDSENNSTDAQTHTVTVTDINEKPMFTQTTFHATIETRDLYQVVVDINPRDVDTEPPNSAANCTIERTTTTMTTPTTTTTTTTPTTTTTTTTPTTTTTTPTTTTTTTTTTTSIGASSVSDQAFQDNITPEKNREISEAISNLLWVCAGTVIVAIALVNEMLLSKV